jgi:ABC-type long-subunit fatty acid transport system fused permease/ATPase subunit
MLLAVEGASQRVQEDSLRLVKGVTRLLSVGLDGVISLCLFSGVLWETALCLPSGEESKRSGWLFVVCVAACVVGLCVSWCLGSRLVGLENSNQAVEAEFRKLLLKLECDADSRELQPVAAEGAFEEVSLLSAYEVRWAVVGAIRRVLQRLSANYRSLYACWVRLSCFLGVFEQGMVILPYILVSPWLVGSGQEAGQCGVTLGTMVAVSNCFGKVFSSLNSISDHMVDLTELRSVVLRLQVFARRSATSSRP